MADVLHGVGIGSSSAELMRDPVERVSLLQTGKRSPNPDDIKIDNRN